MGTVTFTTLATKSNLYLRGVVDYTVTKKNRSTATVKYTVSLQAKSGDSSSHAVYLNEKVGFYYNSSSVASANINSGWSAKVTVSGTSWKTYYTTASGTFDVARRQYGASSDSEYYSVTANFDVSEWDDSNFSGTEYIEIPPKRSYTVTYDGTGASSYPEAGVKWDGEAMTISADVPVRTGYQFVSWNAASDGSGTEYKSGASYTADAALTLYAVWFRACTVSVVSATRGSGTGDAFAEDTEAGTCVRVEYLAGGGTAGMTGTCTAISNVGVTTGTAESGIALSDEPTTVVAYLDSVGLGSQTVTVSVTDGKSTASATAVVPSAAAPGFSMRKSGSSVVGVGIMGAAPQHGVTIDGIPAATHLDVAYVELGTTASRSYSVGDLVSVDGTLCRITQDVALGAGLVGDTNYAKVTGGVGRYVGTPTYTYATKPTEETVKADHDAPCFVLVASPLELYYVS